MRGKIFDDKVRLAADALPKHLRPGGVNPFSVMHDHLSKGIHKLSDEERCAIVDRLDGALTYVYRELKVRAREQGTVEWFDLSRRRAVDHMRALLAIRGA